MWEQAIYIEHEFAKIASEQEIHGWLVNKQRIQHLIRRLDQIMPLLAGKVEGDLPDCPLNIGETKLATPPKKQFKANGEPSALCLKYFDDVLKERDIYIARKELFGRHFAVTLPQPDPITTQRPMLLKDNAHVKEFLMCLGWTPTWWNYNDKDEKTSPKTRFQGILCPDLERMEHPLAQAIVRYMSMRHRKGLLEGLLKVIRPDGRIPSEMATVGSATYRVQHRKIANFPNNESYLGKAIRNCFICEPECHLVSTDSDSCQMRLLAHFLIKVGCPPDDPFIVAILNGTVHTLTQGMAELDTRSQGKKLNYSLLFGQGDASTASTLGLTIPQTKAKKKLFFSKMPSLPRLLRHLKSAWERKGYFEGLDGRPVHADSEHKLLNYALQSAEAIYMKTANCIADKTIKQRNIPARQVCFYHDEFTHEVLDGYQREVADIHELSLIQAGKYLNINVPMTGKATIGKNWREVH